jgi:hypothetical protein
MHISNLYTSCFRFNIQTTLQLVDRFMLMPSTFTTAKFARDGELFARMKLNGDVSEDTAHGRLILQNVNTVYLAPLQAGNGDEKTPNMVLILYSVLYYLYICFCYL